MKRKSLLKMLILAAALAALVAGAAGAQSASSETTLISRADGADGDAGNGSSSGGNRVVSDDGRYVSFTSRSDNLHPDDTDTTFDVFLRDTQTGATILVSRADGTDGDKGNNSSNTPSISADGRFVAFASFATNLDPADAATTVSNDVYVRDLQENETTLVSRANGLSGEKADGIDSGAPSISGDGRFVAFSSDATNLPGDSDTTTDVFVRDLQRGATTLASRAEGSGGVKGNRESRTPSVSDDGLRVAFWSLSTNLHPDDTDAAADIFVRDTQANTTTLASRASGADGTGGAKGNGDSTNPSISGDGLHVSFTSASDNLHPADADADFDAFARDLTNGATTLASRASGADGAAASGGDFGVSQTSISDDGRFVAFDTNDTNLHSDDPDTTLDIFIRDTQENTTILASRASDADGDKGNSGSFTPSLSGDGRHVAFQSRADNLHPADTDIDSDIFLRDFDAPPDTPLDTTITAGPDGATDNNQPRFEFESNEPDSTFECRLDSTDEADFHPCRSPFKTGRLAEGEHTFEVRAIDPSNNPDTTPASRIFTVDTPPPPDTTPPETAITAGPEGATNENRPTFEFESNEPDSTFECRIDSTDEADFHPCRSPFKTGRLAEGEHTFEVRAIDPSGNPDTTPASRAFTVDTVDDPDPPPPNPRGCTKTGTPGNDVLRGTSGRDIICGLGGNDTIRGKGGNDTIYGDAGNDRLYGGKGNDRLNARDGVRGNDRAHGGPGRDRCATDPRDRKVSCP